MFAGFLFTEKFFVDIINMTYSCRVMLDMICMECGNYEDAKENAAFERCADVITSLILKYGSALKQKWNLNEWIRNI